MILSGNLIAKERKRGELYLGGSIFFWDGDATLFGMIMVGGNYRGTGFDLSLHIISRGAIIAGNLKLGFFDGQKLIPYATGGIWTTTAGGFGFSLGGGLVLRLTESLGIRAEYRRLFVGEIEWGLNSILGGICLFYKMRTRITESITV